MKKAIKNAVLLATTLAWGVGLLGPVSTGAALPTTVNGQSLPSLAPILEKVLPTVVSIEVEGTQVEHQRLPEELRFFFGPHFPMEQFNRRPFRGQGSGVIVNAAKGYVVTNHHVVKSASKIAVLLKDGRRLEAKLVGKEEQSDIALLQLSSPKGLKAITFADSDQLQVGDFTIAVGNPFGLGQTATSGIISALGRSGFNLDHFENFIQTDAAINTGNSGGALVNLKGELIGINTAILAPNGGNIGIGFAIPGNMVKNFIDQIVKFGQVRRVMLGITGRDLQEDVAKALKLGIQQGVLVIEVVIGSAAEKAGVKAGDVIVAVEGKPLQNFSELRAKIGLMSPDQTVQLDLLREGKPQRVTVRLQLIESTKINQENLHPALKGVEMRSGDIKGVKGVEVTCIHKRARASHFGLQEGDLILTVNRERVTTVSELSALLSRNPELLALNVQRGASSIYLILR
nr:Do family serine endopeptidase [unidentified bacterial endosymbiont]